MRLRDALSGLTENADILLAKRDSTARTFLAAWNSANFEPLRHNSNITVDSLDNASHSFADAVAKNWLTDKILDALRKA